MTNHRKRELGCALPDDATEGTVGLHGGYARPLGSSEIDAHRVRFTDVTIGNRDERQGEKGERVAKELGAPDRTWKRAYHQRHDPIPQLRSRAHTDGGRASNAQLRRDSCGLGKWPRPHGACPNELGRWVVIVQEEVHFPRLVACLKRRVEHSFAVCWHRCAKALVGDVQVNLARAPETRCEIREVNVANSLAWREQRCSLHGKNIGEPGEGTRADQRACARRVCVRRHRLCRTDVRQRVG
mmetsp:Transcript_22395/g.68214  ORF Transcript_22395/g.68214 Transcript_22395/m.68214 type:complete len:241 (-) Transcript_22395:406-1128(-)